MKKIFLLLGILMSLCELSFAQATWIWYPGDFEIWLSNNMQNRRTDRGMFYPVFWKMDSHYPLVNFLKELVKKHLALSNCMVFVVQEMLPCIMVKAKKKH